MNWDWMDWDWMNWDWMNWDWMDWDCADKRHIELVSDMIGSRNQYINFHMEIFFL